MTEELIITVLHGLLGLCVVLVIGRFLYTNIQGHRRGNRPVETANATVAEKDPTPEYVPGSSNRYASSPDYVYHITFHTENGEILKLYVNPDRFYTIPENASGQLTWQGERFWDFIPDNKKEN